LTHINQKQKYYKLPSNNYLKSGNNKLPSNNYLISGNNKFNYPKSGNNKLPSNNYPKNGNNSNNKYIYSKTKRKVPTMMQITHKHISQQTPQPIDIYNSSTDIYTSSISFKKISISNDKDAMYKNVDIKSQHSQHSHLHHSSSSSSGDDGNDDDDTHTHTSSSSIIYNDVHQDDLTLKHVPKEYNRIINNPCFIKTLFPWKKNIDFQKLQMTKIGKYSISNRYDSTQLSKVIRKILYHFNRKPKQTTITDATASIGGNAISFCMFLGHVNAIELDTLTYSALQHNVEQYQLDNITLFNQNCLDILYDLHQDIVFFDPPWGGKTYKEHTEIDLFLENDNGISINLVDITNILFDKGLFLNIIKIPKNFAIAKFVKTSKWMYFYLMNCKKYNILFLCNQECEILNECENITQLRQDADSNILITDVTLFQSLPLEEEIGQFNVNNMGSINNKF
jgi:16S rRNA G966 N2-methylase RsmD